MGKESGKIDQALGSFAASIPWPRVAGGGTASIALDSIMDKYLRIIRIFEFLFFGLKHIRRQRILLADCVTLADEAEAIGPREQFSRR